MTEIWKDISDYEGIYQISNLGRVKSFHKNNPQILKAHISPAGYYKIQLKMNNHIIIAMVVKTIKIKRELRN